MTKKELRALMIQKRNDINKDILIKQSLSIIEQIKKDPDFNDAKRVAMFYPMGSEVDLWPLLKETNKIFCFPKVEGNHISFYPYDEHTVFIKSPFGVFEPQGEKNIDDAIDYMLAPALAISHKLYRIGYGKGFYDRFLKMHRPKKVMGVIYDFQELDNIPYDEFDEPLDGYFKGLL